MCDINSVEEDFKATSQAWIENFNAGNVDACIDAYLDDCILIVKDVGEFNGKEAIAGFWKELTKTANHIEYSNTVINVINETTVHLSSDWKMNIAEGIITLEEWVKQEDDSWKLSKDEFQITKKYE
eukprot:TRINITY_DN2057_c0_g1_i1.p1 TRINITY_DN2057_c0_g1~~TRINITY_DN2057_c0_g1_i1.p1  ORF type:complete len:126 (-),score=45.59 TRINITY_DN2057_c0_g1_i1:184-561(-)